jgi:hypothetical protein
MDEKSQGLTVDALARVAGVHVETIRSVVLSETAFVTIPLGRDRRGR